LDKPGFAIEPQPAFLFLLTVTTDTMSHQQGPNFPLEVFVINRLLALSHSNR
jgi:hypothetical protein